MTDRPILFSAPMVRPLLSDAKTQTRRVLKPSSRAQAAWLTADLLRSVPAVEVGAWECGHSVSLQHPGGGPLGFIACPYGAPRDRLWVRETWRPQPDSQCERITYAADGAVAYENDIPESWRRPVAAVRGNVPGIHMPRWASRITLEVTGVRVERLCDISEADAVAEGAEPIGITFQDDAAGTPKVVPSLGGPYRDGYRVLWESINGAGSWTANPWVWVVSFRRATT